MTITPAKWCLQQITIATDAASLNLAGSFISQSKAAGRLSEREVDALRQRYAEAKRRIELRGAA